MNKIPVTIPYFDSREAERINQVIQSGWVAQGPVVAEFEKAVAAHEKVGYGVATTSCTTALHLAMAAEGVGEGMEVIVPAFTFVATANAVVQTGRYRFWPISAGRLTILTRIRSGALSTKAM